MKVRKIVTTIIVAAMFFWTPTLIPSFIPARAALGPCFVGVTWIPTDTAFALALPCPVQLQHAATPWVVILFGASVVSVITNAIYISQTQCRELTTPEAWWSASLPFIGIAFNQHNDMCHPAQPHHHHHG
jgi:hypothetical protein